jgi:hypothetical protein
MWPIHLAFVLFIRYSFPPWLYVILLHFSHVRSIWTETFCYRHEKKILCSTYLIFIYICVYIHVWMCVCMYVLWTLYITHILHVTAFHFNKHSRLLSNAVCDTLTSVTIKLPNTLLDVKFSCFNFHENRSAVLESYACRWTGRERDRLYSEMWTQLQKNEMQSERISLNGNLHWPCWRSAYVRRFGNARVKRSVAFGYTAKRLLK